MLFNRKLKAVEEKPKEKRMPLAIDRNSKFIYKGGADVQSVWRRYGWTAPSEYRTDHLFKKNREEGGSK
jgi:hypothetical protein